MTTLPTRTVMAQDGRLVLVGGGDVLLSKGVSVPGAVDGRAGLGTLARQTVRALHARGESKVSLTLDDRLFTGPSQAPRWSPTDVRDGFVAPVYPLEVDAGRVKKQDYAKRSADPALDAARVFAGLLQKLGVAVSGDVHRGSAPAGAAPLGQVDSAPIGDQVEYALTASDNTVAEALGRLVAAKAGQPASFAGVGAAVLAQVRTLGVPVGGAVLADGSGLSAGSRVPAATLTELLSVAARADHPQLRPILSGLPVATVSGTLLGRFSARGQRAAAGVVRAKTGTLIGVSSLAGTVVDADGRLLVFAAMADKVKLTDPARNALDSLATTLAGCGCR
jgi:D-alanyl-D-alanine carboxypeptidase/D-alanyl-D-alanine-endopeptidase (penicillin-binding protein 4)